jgi:hypothetical protein
VAGNHIGMRTSSESSEFWRRIPGGHDKMGAGQGRTERKNESGLGIISLRRSQEGQRIAG